MEKPSKEETTKLIKLYAIKLKSDKIKNVKKAQKCHDIFYAYYLEFSEKYPKYDFSSSAFWGSLEKKANNWWWSLEVKGVGIHW